MTWRAPLPNLLPGLVAVLALLLAPASGAQSSDREGAIRMAIRDAEIAEVLEMLSAEGEVNVVVSNGIEGRVSVNLHDVDVAEAIRAVAAAGGYVVERRGDSYFVVDREDAGKESVGAGTVVRSFAIRYSDPEKVVTILEKHLSRYGRATALVERNMIVVEDLPEFLARIGRIVREVDHEPRQVLLEARVLEVQLNDDQSLGIDWARISQGAGHSAVFGTSGLTTGAGPGFFFDLLTDDMRIFLEAMSSEGRLRALATPSLLAIENVEAEVLVGKRLGYRVTTTINEVTTESVEFIDSGVSLHFLARIDRDERILLEIRPEVSSGAILDGIPNLTTTELTTSLIADDGQAVLIGGMIRDQNVESRTGIPLLSRLPWIGRVFSANTWGHESTETVVIVTPHLVERGVSRLAKEPAARVDRERERFDEQRRRMEGALDEPALDWFGTDDEAASVEDGEGGAAEAAETAAAATDDAPREAGTPAAGDASADAGLAGAGSGEAVLQPAPEPLAERAEAPAEPGAPGEPERAADQPPAAAL